MVPAFEFKSSSKENVELPVEWRGVMQGLQRGVLQPILNDTFAEAFSCLDYERWYFLSSVSASSEAAAALGAVGSYQITYMWPCEPYVVGNSATMPRFDERCALKEISTQLTVSDIGKQLCPLRQRQSTASSASVFQALHFPRLSTFLP
jgi:hypothetical protein